MCLHFLKDDYAFYNTTALSILIKVINHNTLYLVHKRRVKALALYRNRTDSTEHKKTKQIDSIKKRQKQWCSNRLP